MTQPARCLGLASVSKKTLTGTSRSCVRPCSNSAFQWPSTPTATPSSFRPRTSSFQSKKSLPATASRPSLVVCSRSSAFNSSLPSHRKPRVASSDSGAPSRTASPASSDWSAPKTRSRQTRCSGATCLATTAASPCLPAMPPRPGCLGRQTVTSTTSSASSTAASSSTTTRFASELGLLTSRLLPTALLWPTPGSKSTNDSMEVLSSTTSVDASPSNYWLSPRRCTGSATTQTPPSYHQ